MHLSSLHPNFRLIRAVLILAACALFCASSIQSARADAAPPPDPTVGSAGPYKPQKTNVQMLAETVLIDTTKQQRPTTGPPAAPMIQVSASFNMRNQGQIEEKMQVIFPLTQLSRLSDEDGAYTLDDKSFVVKVDGQSVPVTEITTPSEKGYELELDAQSGDPTRGFYPAVRWAAFDVTFPAHKNVKLQVEYDMFTYGEEYTEIEYILETGAGWYGSILSADLIMRLPYPAVEDVIHYANPGYSLVGNEIRWHLKNIEPTRKDNLSVSVISPAIWQKILDLRSKAAQSNRDAKAWSKLGDAYMDFAIGPIMMDNSRFHVNNGNLIDPALRAYQQALIFQPDWSYPHYKMAEIGWAQNVTRTNLQLEDPGIQHMLKELQLGWSYAVSQDSETSDLLKVINAHIPGLNLSPLAPSIVGTPSPTPTPLANPQHFENKMIDSQGVSMLLVPAGEFSMGSNDSPDPAERPAHQVSLDAYYIDKYEVTAAQYQACVDTGACAESKTPVEDKDLNYPISVNWNMAAVYCASRGNGTRLPSEAEWEKAARGTDGRTYPWGMSVDSSKANYGGKLGHPAPGGSYKSDVSVYGVYDLGGNLSEFVLDWYAPDYYQNSPASNPTGPAGGKFRVVRGSSWIDPIPSAHTFRRGAASPGDLYGFRCARPLVVVYDSPTQTATPQPTATKTIEQQSASTVPTIVDAMGVSLRPVPGGRIKPANGREIYLDAFQIDQFEVTNAFYKACVAAGKCARPKQTYSFTRASYYGSAKFDNYPVVDVDWNMAKAYCAWRGARLPSGAEWEQAARDTSGQIYPWGASIDKTYANYNQDVGDTSPVGSYENGKSLYGVYDMSGNVWEWVSDYSEWSDSSTADKSLLNPTNFWEPNSLCWIRGGSWYNTAEVLDVGQRFAPAPANYANLLIGFRCARSIPPAQVNSTPPATPLVAKAITDEKGVSMRIVPAGDFSMGSANGDLNEQPVHTVHLDAYAIDQYEVTNALYRACVTAGVCNLNGSVERSVTNRSYYSDPKFNQYPVIWVSWNRAKAYCEWRGARLPSEAEWEMAARGSDGRTYPWGEGLDASYANFDQNDTSPVGSYPKGQSIYGVYDLAGNVWEWVNDWYAADYYQTSPAANPSGPDSGKFHVLRGGSWYFSDFGLRSTYRSAAELVETEPTIGFRCARSLP